MRRTVKAGYNDYTCSHEIGPYNQMSLLGNNDIRHSFVATTRDGCKHWDILSFLSKKGAIDLSQSCAVCEHATCRSDTRVEALSTLGPVKLDPASFVYRPVSRHHSAESQAQ